MSGAFLQVVLSNAEALQTHQDMAQILRDVNAIVSSLSGDSSCTEVEPKNKIVTTARRDRLYDSDGDHISEEDKHYRVPPTRTSFGCLEDLSDKTLRMNKTRFEQSIFSKKGECDWSPFQLCCD